jgi:GNAT superfamily N-acetyltransferase
MLARAFANDPLAQYVFPEDAVRRQRLISVYRLYLRVFEQKGVVSINDDRIAAALWLPPGRYPLSLTEHLLLFPRMMLATGVQKLPAALRVLTRLEQMHPVGRRFWYLGVLGVEPDRQGSGVGSALLTSGLRNCDQEKVGAYLETAEPRNLPFYSKFGFEVLSASKLQEGPSVWSMWREPTG